MSRLLAVAAAVLVGALALATAASAATPTVFNGNGGFQTRPGSISYTGDGTGVVGGRDGSGPRQPGHLSWTSYTSTAGRATGVVWLNDCRPSCAEGHFQPRPVAVTVGVPRGGHFTHLTLTYSYGGKRIVDTRVLQRHGKYWIYALR
jgi:hypothetical protein